MTELLQHMQAKNLIIIKFFNGIQFFLFYVSDHGVIYQDYIVRSTGTVVSFIIGLLHR